MGTRIVAWTLSGVQQDTWRVHSTLVLPKGHTVTSLDNKAGEALVIGRLSAHNSTSARAARGWDRTGLFGIHTRARK